MKQCEEIVDSKQTAPAKGTDWVERLIGWFAAMQRPFPWRTKSTPYRAWIAEIMLQQTQAPRVVPFFERWMECLPEEGRVFIQKRPAQGLMADLWEFPGGKIDSGETPEEALRRELLEELGLEVVVGEKIGCIRHSYTTFRVSLHVYWCRKKHRQGQAELRSVQERRFVEAEELRRFAFPAANRKLVERLVSGNLSLPSG